MRRKKKSKKICAICGEPVGNTSSKEHVFPRAIWKWNEEYIEANESYNLSIAIESSDNIVRTHLGCNKDKGDAIPDLDELILTEEQRLGLDSIYSEIKDYIESYLEIKDEIILRQDNKCYFCHKELTEEKILRRIDKSKPRLLDNGGVICKQCNESHSEF